MIITIGTTSDDRRKLTKSFSGVNIQVQLKSPCDILNPVFVLSYNTAYLTANYLHCPEFNRYYFINNIEVLTGNRIELSCSVDVLHTYRDAIKSIQANVARNADSSIRNPYISDSAKPIEAKTVCDTYVFNAYPFATHEYFGDYILTVLGGGNRS